MKWLRELAASASRPHNVALEIAVTLVVLGFLFLAFGWSGLAALLLVPFQIPFAVSGGLGGLALVGMGLAVWAIQMGRRDRARDRDDLNALTERAAILLQSRRGS